MTSDALDGAGSGRGAVEVAHASFGWDGVDRHRCRCGEALTPSGASWMNAEPRWLAHLSRVLAPGECPCGHGIDHHGGFVNILGCLDCSCARKPSEIAALAADREPLREAVEARTEWNVLDHGEPYLQPWTEDEAEARSYSNAVTGPLVSRTRTITPDVVSDWAEV